MASWSFHICGNLTDAACEYVKAAGYCTSIFSVDFGTSLTKVPSVQSDSFDGIGHSVSCRVTAQLLEIWKRTANWSSLIARNKVTLVGQ